MNKCVVTMPEAPNGRFIAEFLNPKGELVAKLSFDHHDEKQMGHFQKHWLEHNELRPVYVGVHELEFYPERLGSAFHVSKLRRREEDDED